MSCRGALLHHFATHEELFGAAVGELLLGLAISDVLHREGADRDRLLEQWALVARPLLAAPAPTRPETPPGSEHDDHTSGVDVDAPGQGPAGMGPTRLLLGKPVIASDQGRHGAFDGDPAGAFPSAAGSESP